MKKTLTLVVLFGAGTLFAFSVSVAAQKKIIDRNELWKARSNALNGIYAKKRSVETVTEEYTDGMVVLTTTRVFQFLADDNYRLHHKTETPTGIAGETEEIRVGHFLYRRENSGPWSKEDLRNRASGSGIGSGTGSAQTTLSQVTLDSVFLGNFSANLYEELTFKNGKLGLDLTEKRLWVGQDGALLQEEEIEGAFSPRVVTNRRLVKYEYDPNIKIEAPIP